MNEKYIGYRNIIPIIMVIIQQKEDSFRKHLKIYQLPL